MDLTVDLGRGWTLPNPIIAASGTFGFGAEYADLVPPERLGAVAVKGVSPVPWPGNPPPRVWETPAGLLNSIGLQNPGVEVFLRDYLPALTARGARVIVNIIGHTVEEYALVAARLEEAAGIDALEVNISCPNIKEGGMSFGNDPRSAAAVTRAVRAVTRRPLVVKLSPNVTDVVPIAQAVVDAGADALSCINTVVGLAIDVERRRPALGGITGGLSGPAIKPVALRVVWEVSQAVTVPVIGVGGISSPRDVLEFLMAGARAVMVGTLIFRDPGRLLDLIAELPATLSGAGFASPGEAVGAAHPSRWRVQPEAGDVPEDFV